MLWRTCICWCQAIRCRDKVHVDVHHVFGHAGNYAASVGSRGLVAQHNLPSCWSDRRLLIHPLMIVPHCPSHVAEARTISSSNFCWNGIRFLHDVFLLTFGISHVFFTKFPSHHGFMADRFVWVSAFLPHPLRRNETAHMFSNEERQPAGEAGTSSLSRAASHSFLLPKLSSLSRRASKITSLPMSLSVLITYPSSWA